MGRSFKIFCTSKIQSSESTMEVFENAQVANLYFSYKKSPDGYVLISDQITWPENIISSITLFSKQDYEWYSKPGFLGEGPANFTISVFKNENKLSPLEWVEANPLPSNFNIDQRSSVLPDKISNVDGITYSFPGLHLFDVHVFSYKEEIYLISATYYEVRDKYQTDFNELISTAFFK